MPKKSSRKKTVDVDETRTTDTVALKNDVATERMKAEIKAYLERLQNGLLGVPTQVELCNAGLLHQWLERQKK